MSGLLYSTQVGKADLVEPKIDQEKGWDRVRTLSTTPHTTHTKARSGNPGAWGKIRSAAAEITPENIERIAQRVAQLLRHDASRAPGHARLVDAAYLASHFGLTRAWIYQHADELGAIRLGHGSRARMRFDLDTAMKALSKQAAPADVREQPTRRRQRRSEPATIPLLPITPPGVRSIFARAGRPRRVRGC